MNKLLLKDEMAPKERIEAMLSRKIFDRAPCNIWIGNHVAPKTILLNTN